MEWARVVGTMRKHSFSDLADKLSFKHFLAITPLANQKNPDAPILARKILEEAVENNLTSTPPPLANKGLARGRGGFVSEF